MFLLVSVILLTGGGWWSDSVHAGKEAPPRKEARPQEGSTPLGRKQPPQHTVKERPVRILLECILVFFFSFPV